MTSKRLSQSALLCLIIATIGLPARTLGQPVAASDAVGKTGRFDLTLTERSPLSAAKEMATRFHVKPEELGADYDLSKLVFDVYVPPAPDENGKYGLMVAVVFADGHGFAPEPQRPILDKYHMIWIGPTSEGEGKPIIERIGTCLDATQNAQKIWPIQQGRVYLSMNTNSKVVSGVGLFYPELFDGVLQSLGMTWFIKIEDSHHKYLPEAFPRPPEKSFGVAKTRRFFFAVRDDPETVALDDAIYQRGYQAAGFKNIKLIKVPHDEMGIWSNYGPAWLEQGIQFLDTPSADAKAPSKPSTEPAANGDKSNPVATTPVPGKPITPSTDDPTAKAAQALSLAKNYVSAQKYDLARQKLQKIVDTYPDTPAAKEATTILSDIQGK